MPRGSTEIEAKVSTAPPQPLAGNGKAPLPSIDELFGTDLSVEQEGVWLTHQVSGIKLRIAAAENPRHMAVLDSLGESRLRALENQELAREERHQERVRIAAVGLLRGWQGVSEPFSEATAMEKLGQEGSGWRHLVNWIFARSLDYQNFLITGRERDAKN
jgi:hypothetical protein